VTDDTRARILKEAERLFRHYGYAKTTVADIASACGMSPANVYRFFASKAEINEGICKTIMADVEGRLRAIVDRDAPASERLSDFLQLLATFTAETLLHEKKVHDMVVVAMEEQWAAVQQHIHNCNLLAREIIASGVATGEFDVADVEVAARCVCTASVAFKHPTVAAQCIDDPNVAKPGELIAFLLKALKP
jgi:AcrR family transcriptional regulator